jgi:DNA-binding winged helix-turn-helix (wHTH) protein
VETRSNHRVRFKSFELDLSSKELRRNGLKLKVQGQPVEVLTMLLERPGEVVTREQIQHRLWPEDTFVDFEHGLNTTIRRLREALGDSADDPQFIETIPRLGYRFIAQIEPVDELASARLPNNEAGVTIADARSADMRLVVRTVLSEPAAARQPNWLRKWRWVLGGAAGGIAALVAFACWYLLHLPSPPRITAYTQLTHVGGSKVAAGTDGNRVYFYFQDPSRDPVSEVSVSGGEIEHIPIRLQNIDVLEDVSPDGASLLLKTNEEGIVASRPQWNVSLIGGALRRLPDGNWAGFSPDGKVVVYSTPDGNIFIAGSDGSNSQRLASVGGVAGSFAWSPNGKAIRFTKSPGRLWEITAQGSNLHELLPDWRTSDRQCCGRWTPDGTLFLFLNVPKGLNMRSEIWVLDERPRIIGGAHNKPVQLTSGPMAWGQPVPSKDGAKVFAEGKTYRGELLRFDAKRKQFEPFLAGISAQGVAFSRDGKYVAYVSFPEGTLWKANRDGSHAVPLTNGPQIEAFEPRWSPDGSRIIFSSFTSVPYQFAPAPCQTYIVSTEGGAPRRLLPDEKEPVADPNWSPDGRRVLFSTWKPHETKGDLRVWTS